ncbi:hypothetical protein FHS44_005086 [Streptosporangium saharense]|uniref:Secreted protein n=1 Tax=Streptosporangium saharense TaxID=1706840 RepID=A0A7W7QRR6_9ACTN|nr:hypothetical protein [Streptosporangium saharense]
MTGWWRRARIMSAVGAGTLVLGAGSVVHAAGVGDAVPEGMAGFRLWLSGPGSDARLRVVTTAGTEIRSIGCFAPVSGGRASAGGVPEGRFPGGRPSEGRSFEGRLPEEGVSGGRVSEGRLSGGWRECLVGEVGARTAVDVLLSAPTAGDGLVGLVATLRMRTPEGEWVTRTASGLGAVRPAESDLGEAGLSTRRDPVGVEIEPITWEDAGAQGAGVPGSVGGAGTRDVLGASGVAEPVGGSGVSGSRGAPGELRGTGASGSRDVSGVAGALEGPRASGVSGVSSGSGDSGAAGASGGLKAPGGRGETSVPSGYGAVGALGSPRAPGGSDESGVPSTSGGSETVGASGGPRTPGEGSESSVPSGAGGFEAVGASGGPKVPGGSGEVDVPGAPGEAKVGARPYKVGKRGRDAGRGAVISGASVSAGMTGQVPPVWNGQADVLAGRTGQVPPLGNDPGLRMPLAAPTTVAPAIAAEVPPPGAPLPQDVDGPGQEIEPVALWTPSLTGASGFPVVGGSVGGLLGLLWLQARIQRRRGTR